MKKWLSDEVRYYLLLLPVWITLFSSLYLCFYVDFYVIQKREYVFYPAPPNMDFGAKVKAESDCEDLLRSIDKLLEEIKERDATIKRLQGYLGERNNG